MTSLLGTPEQGWWDTENTRKLTLEADIGLNRPRLYLKCYTWLTCQLEWTNEWKWNGIRQLCLRRSISLHVKAGECRQCDKSRRYKDKNGVWSRRQHRMCQLGWTRGSTWDEREQTPRVRKQRGWEGPTVSFSTWTYLGLIEPKGLTLRKCLRSPGSLPRPPSSGLYWQRYPHCYFIGETSHWAVGLRSVSQWRQNGKRLQFTRPQEAIILENDKGEVHSLSLH